MNVSALCSNFEMFQVHEERCSPERGGDNEF